MPFMQGRGALRRTIEYLEKGRILLRDNVQIMAFHYNPGPKFPHHQGLDQFVFWHSPQLKFKNPDVQFLSFKYLTPTPFIRIFLDDDRQVLVDCDCRSRQDIHEHVCRTFGKSEEQLAEEASQQISITQNPANFGFNYDRQCICEVPGQVPCPGWLPLPKLMRGKYKRKIAFGELDASEIQN